MNAGPHHPSPPEPTLASDQVSHYLQALLAHAPDASWSPSVADLPGRERLRSSSSLRYELPQLLKLEFGELMFSSPDWMRGIPFRPISGNSQNVLKLTFGELKLLRWCTIVHCRCNWRMKWRNAMCNDVMNDETLWMSICNDSVLLDGVIDFHRSTPYMPNVKV